MRLQFLGANRQVTGSRYLLEVGGKRVLIDCGLFQEREVLARNWETSPVPPAQIDALILTHAHLDHCGLLPRLVRHGYRGPIYATEPTIPMAELVMLDSARLQAEDAEFKRQRHAQEQRQSRFPVEPLYEIEDARQVMPLFRPMRYSVPQEVVPGLRVTFKEAGHILGSSFLQLDVQENGRSARVIFSGDLGQTNKPLIRDPEPPVDADYLILESTYGDRNHEDSGDIPGQIEGVVKDAIARGGNVVIPTFALERAQELIFHLGRLLRAKRIPPIPVFLDSPMATDVTNLFRTFRGYMDEETLAIFASGDAPLKFPGLTLARSRDESKAINAIRASAVIMAGAGMCTGGRIKHHLAQNITRPECTILFCGYQSAGTLGRQIKDRNDTVRIFGQIFSVRAHVAELRGMSAHADQSGLLAWAANLRQPPRHVFLTHGEMSAATALAQKLQQQPGWTVTVPEYKQVVTLD